MTLELWQVALSLLIGLIAGVSKTGLPGIGILMVPLVPLAFPGNEAVGTLLPILVGADIFAVAWYRHHARWDLLWRLYPTVLLGIGVGYWILDDLAKRSQDKNALNPVIGGIVLVMLIIALLRKKLGDRLKPGSKVGTQLTGAAAGVTTTLANAGGPVMGLYFSSIQLPKNEFMGTSAWYFFSLNLLKVPLYAVLTTRNPDAPFFTQRGMVFVAVALPAIFLGAQLGRKVLAKISQESFDVVVITLSGLFAIKLLVWP